MPGPGPGLDAGDVIQRAKIYLGPTLGWRMLEVRPQLKITAGGTFVLAPGTSVVLVNVAALVTIQLPDAGGWNFQSNYVPVTGFENGIWIKDIGGNAATFPITVLPFGAQTIDTKPGIVNGNPLTVINTARGIVRLIPLVDGSGWYVA